MQPACVSRASDASCCAALAGTPKPQGLTRGLSISHSFRVRAHGAHALPLWRPLLETVPGDGGHPKGWGSLRAGLHTGHTLPPPHRSAGSGPHPAGGSGGWSGSSGRVPGERTEVLMELQHLCHQATAHSGDLGSPGEPIGDENELPSHLRFLSKNSEDTEREVSVPCMPRPLHAAPPSSAAAPSSRFRGTQPSDSPPTAPHSPRRPLWV